MAEVLLESHRNHNQLVDAVNAINSKLGELLEMVNQQTANNADVIKSVEFNAEHS